ncbi:MAG TPA: hypothetical protein PLC74_09180, partial [Acetobacteraceae bacterium]|nr:hypothetical protein [Acetobacteraceae bacterium]
KLGFMTLRSNIASEQGNIDLLCQMANIQLNILQIEVDREKPNKIDRANTDKQRQEQGQVKKLYMLSCPEKQNLKPP